MRNEIEVINDVIDLYFQENPKLNIVPVKELMPSFILADVFKKDVKKGKPIRDVLRKLSKAEELHLIPTVHAQEQEQGTYWYFVRPGTKMPETGYKQQPASDASKEAKRLRLQRDESYVIDLCDTFLEQKSQRHKRFDFLLGDLHSDGKTRTKLPVDAWYPELNLVVEYMESPQSKPNDISDKGEKKTVSGVGREEQRRRYDNRRAEVLPENGIQLVHISYDSFSLDGNNRIVRNPAKDLKAVAAILKSFKRPDADLKSR